MHPLDAQIGIEWPTTARDGSPIEPQLSAKDLGAPTLAEAMEQGVLPRYDEVSEYLRTLP